MNGRLRERRILVAGGSGTIGKAVVRALAGEGAFVAMASRSGQKLKDANQELKREGLDVFAVVLDVESAESLEEVVHLLNAHWGGIDVVFNCVGIGMAEFNPRISESAIPFHAYKLETLRKAMDVNYFGHLALMQTFIPGMLEQGSGMIVNVSMDRELLSVRGFSPVSPARAATNTLTDIASLELQGTGVTANLLTPGGFVKGGMIPADAQEKNFGRFLPPEIMAEPAIFLASGEASGLNGAHIVASRFNPEDYLQRRTGPHS
jgi:NAD(P)-dependent dehydrogenase (short-subunit alcohol dehydrogenase family)